METRKRIKFTFVSAGVSEDTFIVVKFRGVEEISKPYEYDISLASEDPEIDLKKVLKSPATFTIFRDDEEYPIFGVLSQFEQLHEDKQYTYYRAVLVPRLWEADLYRENQLFLEKSVKDIIEEILKQTGLTTRDYELHLKRTYKKWEYICQYQETDLDFISRWMEREGIYYFFEQTDENEKVIITDNSSIHKDIPGEKKVHYSPPSEVIPDEKNVITSLICRQKTLPKKVMLKDYNYRKPSLDLTVENEVDAKGRGTVYIYGEHYKSPEEGKDLAKIRGEELKAREEIYYGESSVPALRPGYIFELDRHYRDSYNGKKYMVIEVEHEGSQEGTFSPGFEREISKGEKEQDYTNRFVAIPADVQFRPERKTQKPRFNGTMNARVDAAGDGQYAEIDEEGRYKVVLPFDMSGNKDGKASRWVRMAQPYAGAEYGMHFPLHKGTEVLLTFVDGDPDRPVISGSIPNPETKSPITSDSHTKSMIKTAAQNEIMIEDQAGAEKIILSTPNVNSKIYMGATASTDGIRATTEGHGVLHAKKGIYLNAWPTDYFSTGDASQIINTGIALASGLSTMSAAAGAGKLGAMGAIARIASAVSNIIAPGIVFSAPAGISAITPSMFTSVGILGISMISPAAVDIIGGLSASLMSQRGVNIYTVSGGIRCVASNGDVDIHAKNADIKGSAKNNISLQALTNNIALQAKKDIDIVSNEGDVMLETIKEDILIQGKKNIKATAIDENIELVAKKKLVGVAKEDNIELNGKKKVSIVAENDEIELKCGSASITLKRNGRIDIKGTTVDVSASSGALYLSGPSFELKGNTVGTIKANTALDLKGTPIKINC